MVGVKDTVLKKQNDPYGTYRIVGQHGKLYNKTSTETVPRLIITRKAVGQLNRRHCPF
jgi:hypothetical protein